MGGFFSSDLKKKLSVIRKISNRLSEEEQLTASIKEVKVDGYLLIRIDNSEKLYKVEEMHRYTEGKKEKWQWFELKLFCAQTAEILYLEWEEDDELEVNICTKNVLKLKDIGITAERLWEIDDEEEGSLVYNGKTYEYEESDKAKFYRNMGNEGEEYYYWDFETGKTSIGIECWDKSSFDVNLSESIDLDRITIISKGGTNEK